MHNLARSGFLFKALELAGRAPYPCRPGIAIGMPSPDIVQRARSFHLHWVRSDIQNDVATAHLGGPNYNQSRSRTPVFRTGFRWHRRPCTHLQEPRAR